VKTLLIDNYDSFTYNLFQLLAEVNGDEPHVVRNDAAPWAELERLPFDNVVISPGPGRPERQGDFGICGEAIAQARVPLLGVCLGHQGLSSIHGGSVSPAAEAMHGRVSTVRHDGSPLFEGIPPDFQAVRYHSLVVAEPLPEPLEAIAWTRDGTVMAVRHRTRPQWGVQFHPESVCTEHGRALLANFRDLTRRFAARSGTVGHGRPTSGRSPRAAGARPAVAPGPSPGPLVADPAKLVVKVRRLDTLYDAERSFVHLYGANETAFWLDSSKVDERARFSYMGAAGGPLSAVIHYDVGEGELRLERADRTTEILKESIFDFLSREMRGLRQLSPELPFDFNGGFVGYFGYELKADCEGDAAHSSSMPDAAFVFADRLIAFDHLERCTYLVCLTEPGRIEQAERWIERTSVALASAPPVGPPARDPAARDPAARDRAVAFRLGRSHRRYLEDIAVCKQRLLEGETYEICLTNKIAAEGAQDPLTLYRTLRRVNPAPFSAYLRFGEDAILSSSPERFISVGRDRWVEARPIKGTCARGRTPAEDVRMAEQLRLDEKSRAENLMIADLLRNDLGVVCEVGTVQVPELMQVETFQTVHQLVTTVRGRLRPELEPPDCVRACFPGGSMTGAPKKRTMEIIDELEGEARGVYSGAIGYLGLSGGCDLSIVIRTIVVEGEDATLGVGGAIVLQSDAEQEYQETLLKARAPMAAIDPGVDPHAALAPGAEAEPVGLGPPAAP